MKQIIIPIFLIIFAISQYSYAECITCSNCKKNHEAIDKMLNERLKLTKEQNDYIKTNRLKHSKEMELTIQEMTKIQQEIKIIYSQKLPKIQTDMKVAPLKMELASLKNEAIEKRNRNRKNFENILNAEQKAEFELIKKEFSYENQHNKELNKK